MVRYMASTAETPSSSMYPAIPNKKRRKRERRSMPAYRPLRAAIDFFIIDSIQTYWDRIDISSIRMKNKSPLLKIMWKIKTP
jgi:hypothetical protein